MVGSDGNELTQQLEQPIVEHEGGHTLHRLKQLEGGRRQSERELHHHTPALSHNHGETSTYEIKAGFDCWVSSFYEYVSQTNTPAN